MKIKLISGSRIHLGFYNIKSFSTVYGSAGIYLEEPKTIVEVTHSKNNIVIKGLESNEIDRVSKLLKEFCGEKGITAELVASPPRHVGLGSTTQILLSIARAGLSLCVKKQNKINTKYLAAKLGRGLASGIGLYGFMYGGFVVDGGRKINKNTLSTPSNVKDLPFLLYRRSFPKKLKILLVLPEKYTGLDERSEEPIIKKIPEIDVSTNIKLLSIFHGKILRGIVDNDYRLFGEGVNYLQDLLGEVFRPYQGGRFSHDVTEKIIGILRSNGAYGAGQSSWGPLAYGFFSGKKLRNYLEKIKLSLEKENISFKTIITTARNRGYEIRIS